MQTRVFGIISVATLLAAGVAQAQSAQPDPGGDTPTLSSNVPGALVIERILVKVNGELVTQTDLEKAQIAALRSRPPLQTEAELERLVQELTPDLFTNTVDNLLLVQRGRELGLALQDEQFDEILDGIKVENDFDDDQLVEALATSEGMTLQDLRGVMEEQMLIQQVQQMEVNRKISLTGTEAREYYDEHLDEFTNPATATLREILIAVPTNTGPLAAAGAERAAETAEAVLARVLDGEDFAQVASEVSDAPSKANGGLIGPIPVGDLAEAVRVRVEALEVGEISAVEQTAAGHHLLKLEAMTEATPIPFDGIREQIVDSVFESRRIGALNDYLAELRAAAIIEWNDENLRQIYEVVVTTRSRGSGD